MNTFDQRWQSLAQSALQVPDDPAGELPFGFSTQIIARFRNAPMEPWTDIVSLLGLRTALATVLVCLAGAAFAWAEWYDLRIEPPALEKAIAAELDWP